MKYHDTIIERMLKETCDCTDEMLEEVNIDQIRTDEYRVYYKEDNPYEGFDFCFKITYLRHDEKDLFHFHIFNSVYADDGDFFLDYHLIPDHEII